MLERQSLRDIDPRAGDQSCAGCARVFPAWALYPVRDDVECGECVRAAELAEVSEPLATGWASEAGKTLKAERDRALDGWRWSVLPDSPLSADCQAAFARYLAALHRMTVDYEPETWAWPEVPTLDY